MSRALKVTPRFKYSNATKVLLYMGEGCYSGNNCFQGNTCSPAPSGQGCTSGTKCPN